MASNDLRRQFKRITKEIVANATNATEKATLETLTSAQQHIESIGGYNDRKGGKKYRKSFYIKAARAPLTVVGVLANKKYQLTHLLEKGHIVRKADGGFTYTRAFPHWAQTEERAVEEFETRLKQELEKGL